jgi:pimeloyl-ACP methyl ester carboxylesterase
MFKDKFNIKNSYGLNLSAVFEGENKDGPLVILCHGYDSSKDSPSNASLAEELVKRGISAFRFDFTGNGESEGDLGELTPKRGLDDLKSAITHQGFKKFGLVGSSFGGTVALLYATENPLLALALKAPVSDYGWVSGNRKLTKRRKRFSNDTVGIFQKVKNINSPVLIVHGDADKEVSVEMSEKLYESLGTEKRLEIIKGCPHQFRGEHLDKANKMIINFFQEKRAE